MATKPTALITGITGQDGGYLAEYLLKLGYIVIGLRRRTSNRNLGFLKNLYKKYDGHFDLIDGDMTDAVSLMDGVRAVQPSEIYNLAAQSFVGTSWNQPMLTSDVNFMGTLRLLEACRHLEIKPKVYQASTSEMFGNSPAPQNEDTPMIPRSPYGLSKLAAHRLCGVYRDSFDLFISCGILFNHESPSFRMVLSHRLERGKDKILNGMSLACGNHKIVGAVLLKHEPHCAHVIASKPPVSFRRCVAQRYFILLEQTNPRHAIRDLASNELPAASWALVVEQYPTGNKQVERIAVNAAQPMSRQLR